MPLVDRDAVGAIFIRYGEESRQAYLAATERLFGPSSVRRDAHRLTRARFLTRCKLLEQLRGELMELPTKEDPDGPH